VSWQISHLYSISVHTLLSKLCVTEVTAPLVPLMSSSKRVAIGCSNTSSLMCPERKESMGIRSGERDGQVISPPLPIRFPGKWCYRKPHTSLPSLAETACHWDPFFQNVQEVFFQHFFENNTGFS
jgi:hypothetical protein